MDHWCGRFAAHGSCRSRRRELRDHERQPLSRHRRFDVYTEYEALFVALEPTHEPDAVSRAGKPKPNPTATDCAWEGMTMATA